MADATPIKATFDGGGNATGFAEFQTGDVVPVAIGGTGATTAADARTNLGAAADDLSNVSNVAGPFSVGGAAQTIAGSVQPLQVTGVGTGALAVSRFNSGLQGPGLFLAKSRGTTLGTFTAVESGDNLGRLLFCGADGTAINTPFASIIGQVDGTVSTGIVPTALQFNTTAVAGLAVERLRIGSSGAITCSGQVALNRGYTEVLTTITASGGGTVTLDCSLGNHFRIDQSSNITLAFSNVPTVFSIIITRVKDATGTTRTITFPAAVKWGGSPITLTQSTGAIDRIVLDTIDGGTTWFAVGRSNIGAA
jgi:hypothetical protein